MNVKRIQDIQETVRQVLKTNGHCLTDQVSGHFHQQNLRDADAILGALRVVPEAIISRI